MIVLMLLTFFGAIYCCTFLSCSFVKLVYIGSNDPKLKIRRRSKTVWRWKIILLQNMS